jgi:hypothetical protein
MASKISDTGGNLLWTCLLIKQPKTELLGLRGAQQQYKYTKKCSLYAQKKRKMEYFKELSFINGR